MKIGLCSHARRTGSARVRSPEAAGPAEATVQAPGLGQRCAASPMPGTGTCLSLTRSDDTQRPAATGQLRRSRPGRGPRSWRSAPVSCAERPGARLCTRPTPPGVEGETAYSQQSGSQSEARRPGGLRRLLEENACYTNNYARTGWAQTADSSHLCRGRGVGLPGTAPAHGTPRGELARRTKPWTVGEHVPHLARSTAGQLSLNKPITNILRQRHLRSVRVCHREPQALRIF